jgi:hypothetical protein
MKYFLISALVFFGLFLLGCAKLGKGSQDENIADEFVKFMLAIIAAALMIIYLALVFWTHRFW